MPADAERQRSEGPPTEEIYLRLQKLQTTAADPGRSPAGAVAPAVAADDPSSIKARIARLRAILSDRGAQPPA